MQDTNRSTPQNDDDICEGDADRPVRGDGRPRRSGRAKGGHDDYGSPDELDDEEEAVPSGDIWSGNDDDMEERYDEDHADEDDDVMSDEADEKDSLLDEPRSLIVSLRYKTSPNDVMDGQHIRMEENRGVHDNSLGDPANGASADMTIGEAPRDSFVSAQSLTTDQQPAMPGPLVAGEQRPKQELEDVIMADNTARSHLPSRADGSEQLKDYHDNHHQLHDATEQSQPFAMQAPAFITSSVNG